MRRRHRLAASVAVALALASCSETPPPSKTATITIEPVTPTVPANAQRPAGAVAVVRTDAGYELRRNGKPYYVNGAGGSAHLDVLANSGGNTTRTWGVDAKTKAFLDEAHAHGLAVTVGIWIGHERHGFRYDDAGAVRRQFDDATKWIRTYRGHPAVLVWGIGNEMEGNGDNPKIWQAIEDIARAAREIDPDHPTMTVIAELGGNKIRNLHRHCPSIDIVGINSYGGASSMPERYRKAGGTKPYIVTEYGPLGTWETGKSAWGAPLEQTSTDKAGWYAKAYRALEKDTQLCLGSHAFVWGHKQEATPTWFGLFLPDGSKLAGVDALAELWSDTKPENLCPAVDSIAPEGKGVVGPGRTVRVNIAVSDPEGDPLRVQWKLLDEAGAYHTQGDRQATPASHRDAIREVYDDGVVVRMPASPGKYRLYAYVRDGKGGAATANVPLLVEGVAAAPKSGPRTALPHVVYADGASSPYVPSGWMGDTGSIRMDANSTDAPHAGATCIRAAFTSGSGWGGVVWQSPANDWGDKPGGLDLTGARALTFWARGARGGEEVTFGAGLIKREKPYHDTCKVSMKPKLTSSWRQYEISLAGADLSRVKSGFYWTVAASGAPMTFFVDDIRYEGGRPNSVSSAGESMPYAVYADGAKSPFSSSGWMGDTGAIAFDDAHRGEPHIGATCIRASFNKGNGWGGVVWQHPANDWGDRPGGVDLSQARALTFWAKGKDGGEVVKIGMGLIGEDKPHHDSSGKVERAFTLTSSWRRYRIDLAGRDLSRVKTPFYWTVAASGQPLTFYLDDVIYVAE